MAPSLLLSFFFAASLLPHAAVAQAGYSVSPPVLGFTVPSAPPQPPAGVAVGPASDSSLAISWTPPLDDGGADLLAYKVHIRFFH